MLKQGKILSISGHPASGLWQMHIETQEGLDVVHISSGHGIRQFVSAFGSFNNIEGQFISYSVDDLGIMEGFSPIAAS